MKHILTFFLSLALLSALAQTSQSTSYQYDALGRLTKVIYPSGSSITYNYDVLGNRVSVVTTAVSCTPPAAPTVSSATINSGQTATLTATNCAGTANWYDVATGGNALVTGNNSYTTPALTTTAIYYASCTVGGCESTTRGSGTVTVNPACQQPDLIVQDIVVTKYSSDRIFYAVKIKNIGNQTANLENFSFSTYGSSDVNKDNADAFKNAYMFLGGGDLHPGITIIYDVSASISYSTNNHYFIVISDPLNLISECDETNNSSHKLVIPCTHLSQFIVTGTYGPGLVAANGLINATNLNIQPNTVFVATSFTGQPNITAFQNNISFITGNCANEGLNNTSNIIAQNVHLTEPVFEFKESLKDEIKYRLTGDSSLKISVWNQETKSIYKELKAQSLSAGTYTLPLFDFNLIQNQTYIIHFETPQGNWAKVVEW